MALIPLQLAEFVDAPGQPVQLAQEFGSAFPTAASHMVSVAWSADPALGLPVAPAIVWANGATPSIEGYSKTVIQVILEWKNGFEENLIPMGPAIGPDGLLCVLAYADFADSCDVFALDAAGDEIPETRQHVANGSPILFLGPGIFGVRATGAMTLNDVLLIGLPPSDGLELVRKAEVAPTLTGVSCYEPQAYLGVPDTVAGSLATRLKADALARANTEAPSSAKLENKVHRARPQPLSDAVVQQRFLAEAEANFSSILANPAWSYFEPVVGASAAEFEVVPTALIQAVALVGPIEATTLGQAVSFPVAGKLPVLTRLEDIFYFIRTYNALPFPLVLVETFHAGPRFVDKGTVVDNRADPNTRTSKHFARLILPTEQSVEAVQGKARPPRVLDAPATCDVRLIVSQKSRLDTFYVEKIPGSEEFFEEDAAGGKGFVKAYFPSIDVTDVVANGRAQFTTGPFDLPFVGPADNALGLYRRDIFGRWLKTLDAVCSLQPWPVQAPTLSQTRIENTASGRTLLVSTIGWDWALRTPKDLRLGVAIVKEAKDPLLQTCLPSDGLNLPDGKLQLSIVFDSQGKPGWSAGVSADFSIAAIDPPAPDPDDPPLKRGSPGDPDPRQYQMTIPLGSTAKIFDETPAAYVALTSDAWEVVSGSTESRRSVVKARSINRLNDPRPPAFEGSLWNLQWASRANGANVARAFLKSPAVVGATKAASFNVWRANESSLLDFATEGVDPDDAALILAAIRRETNMRVRLSLVQNMVMGRLNDITSFERFTSLFRSAETAAAKGGFEIDLPGTQAGLEFAMFTATSTAGVSSMKFDQKGLSNLYAVAIPVAATPQQPSLQIITRDPLELLARSGLCVAIVGFEQRGSQRRVRFFWEDGPDVVDANQLLHEIEPVAELSVADAKRYVEDIDGILDRITFGQKRIYILRPPETWLAHNFCADTIAALPIGSDDPMNEIASRRSQLVRKSILPTSLPALFADAVPESGSWKVRPQGIFVETVPGFVPCEIMFSLNDSDGAELGRTGPVPYRDFAAIGIQLAPHFDARYDQQEAKIVVNFVPKLSGRTIRLTATDPARRAVQVDLLIP